MSKAKLGDYVRCKISGFEGTVTSRTEYLNQCVKCGIQPKVGSDGKLPDAFALDEITLEVLKPAVAPVTNQDKGGPSERIERERA